MIALALVVLLLIMALGVCLLLLGFRLGEEQIQRALEQVKVDAEKTGRQLFDLTVEAFVAMGESAKRHRE